MDIVTDNGIGVEVVVSETTIELIVNDAVDLEFVQLGVQGLKGATGATGDKGDIGDPLVFEELTEAQKLALRGDVGDTSTNYTNLFNSVLLS